MHKSLTPRLIPALITLAFAGSASASGFQLYGEQSAHGIGNAGAGSAASAENASTIYFYFVRLALNLMPQGIRRVFCRRSAWR